MDAAMARNGFFKDFPVILTTPALQVCFFVNFDDTNTNLNISFFISFSQFFTN